MTEYEEDAEEVGREKPENQEKVRYERGYNFEGHLQKWSEWAERKHRVSNFKLVTGGLVGIITYPISAYAVMFYALYQVFVAPYSKMSKDERWKKLKVEEVEEE